jgi:hypothetical protein
MEDENEEITLNERSAIEIAERLLALLAVTARSENNDWIHGWVERFGIRAYLSPTELDFFDSETPDPQAVMDHGWRLEAMVSLMWSLGGLPEMPSLTEQFRPGESGIIQSALKNPHSFRLSAVKRLSEELDEMELFLYHQHWRVRDAQLGFNHGAKLPLQEGELPVEMLNPSIVLERRYAMSWVVGWGDSWDEVPTDT